MSARSGASPEQLVERALELAGATEGHAGTSVIVGEDSTTNLRWACNTLTTNGMSTGQSVTVSTAVRTGRGVSLGTVTRSGVTLEGLDALVTEAAAAAAAAPPAEDAADLVDGGADPGFAASGEDTGPQVLAPFAEGLGPALEAARAADRELFGFAEHTVSTTWLGTSAGTRRRHVQPTGTVELTGKSHQRSRSTYVCQATRDFTDVDITSLDAEITTRLGWQAKRIELEPGRYDTVLPPTSVADLMIYLYWSSDARSAHEGRSVFSRKGGQGTRIGDRLTDVPLTMSSDPDYPGMQCSPYVSTSVSHPFASVFDNGMASPATTWLDAGTIAALPSTRFTSTMAGVDLHPTVDNLALTSPDGAGSTADLVAGTERGLLVTSLWYIREVDPMTLLLTGLTRDGVYLVEGGEVQGVVTNFRFNESPVDLLQRVDAVGATEIALSREWNEFFSRTAMPAMRIRDFNMSSVSQGT